MNCLYLVETVFFVMGVMVDNCLRLCSIFIGFFLFRVVLELGIDGLGMVSHSFGLDQEMVEKWVKVLVVDLKENGGCFLVCVG